MSGCSANSRKRRASSRNEFLASGMSTCLSPGRPGRGNSAGGGLSCCRPGRLLPSLAIAGSVPMLSCYRRGVTLSPLAARITGLEPGRGRPPAPKNRMSAHPKKRPPTRDFAKRAGPKRAYPKKRPLFANFYQEAFVFANVDRPFLIPPAVAAKGGIPPRQFRAFLTKVGPTVHVPGSRRKSCPSPGGGRASGAVARVHSGRANMSTAARRSADMPARAAT